MEKPLRCVNIDWLELYCYEPASPRDASYFASLGFAVQARDYGTRHWSQVFTILDDHYEPMIEIRRAPRHQAGKEHTVYPDNACNIRLVNRYCYFGTCVWLMADFIEAHNYTIRRIFRLDLCIDFKIFDSGDKPEKVVRRIIRHKYAKVYQSERTAHGRDYWNGCEDNSLSWGRRGSMIVTRFYNKSLELAQKGDKPWIRQAWHEAGLIDDPVKPILLDQNGRVIGDPVWRVEFQINSSARGWFVDDSQSKDSYVEHTLETYWNKQLQLQAIANLIDHYFDFRIFEQGKSKYDCRRKQLFDIKIDDATYVLRNSLARRSYSKAGSQWLKWMIEIRTHLDSYDLRCAADDIIEDLAEKERSARGFSAF